MNRYLSRTLYIGLALLVHYSTLSQPMHPMPISLVPMQVLDSGFTSWQWLNPLPQGNDLYDVCIVDSNTVVAVGGNGTIIRSVNSGVTWEVNHRTGGSYTILTSVHFSSEKTGIILGGRADIDRWGSVILGTTNGGATWIEQPASYHGNLSDAWSIDDQTKIVIGDSGTILRSSNGGGTWSLRQSGTLSALAAVAFANESLGFAVGDSGTILRTTDSGLSWDRLASGTTGFLKRLQVLDTALVFAVGNAGTLLRTTNGGDSWQLIWPWYAADLIGFSYETEESWTIMAPNVVLRTTDGGWSWAVHPYPACVQSLVYSSAVKSRLCYAVGSHGIILRSRNGGVDWECQSHGSTWGLKSLVMIDDRLGMAVGDAGMIVRTTNGGLSWSNQQIETVSDLNAITFPGDFIGFAVGDNGTIFKSTDAGQTWAKQASGTEKNLLAVSFSDDSVGTVVGDSSTVLRTTDGGHSWNGLQSPPPLWSWAGVSSIDRNTIVVVGRDYPWGGWIIRSTNGGSSWTTPVSYSYQIFSAVSFSDSKTGTAVGSGILHTTDGGLSWTEQRMPHGVLSFLVAVSSLSEHVSVAVGSGAAVLATTNGGSSWFPMGTPAWQSLRSVSFARHGGSSVVYVAGLGGTILCAAMSPLSPRTWTWVGLLDSSWNNPVNWTPVGIPLPGDSIIIPPAVHSPIVDSVQQQIVIASLNILSGGRLTITDALPRLVVLGDVTVNGTLEVRPPAQTTIIVGGNWTIQPGGFNQRFASLARFKSALASDAGFIPYHSTVLFSGSGTMEGNFYNLMFDSASVMRSGGNVTIENQCTTIGDVDLQVVDTVTLTSPEPQALVGPGKFLRGTVRRTLGKGVTESYSFESIQTSLRFNGSGTYPASVTMTVYPDTNPSGFGDRWEVVPSRIDTVFNTISADSLTHFTTWAIGTPRPRVTLLKSLLGTASDTIPIIRRVYRITAQGADSAGFVARLSLRYDQSEVPEGVGEDSLVLLRSDFVDGVKDHNSLSSYVPKEYRLEQNYPNPFNPGTTIRFEIPVSAFVTLKVYNLLGQEVATLVNGKREAGSHKVEFSAEGLPSGVYFYRIQAGDFIQIKKLLLMR